MKFFSLEVDNTKVSSYSGDESFDDALKTARKLLEVTSIEDHIAIVTLKRWCLEGKIAAIKFYKDKTGLGLVDAKRDVESICGGIPTYYEVQSYKQREIDLSIKVEEQHQQINALKKQVAELVTQINPNDLLDEQGKAGGERL